jgi:hypothetical protein
LGGFVNWAILLDQILYHAVKRVLKNEMRTKLVCKPWCTGQLNGIFWVLRFGASWRDCQSPRTARLDAGDTKTRKGYIRSIIDAVEVDDQAIRIIGSKDSLQAAIAGKQTENGNARGFVRKWRAKLPPKLRTRGLG